MGSKIIGHVAAWYERLNDQVLFVWPGWRARGRVVEYPKFRGLIVFFAERFEFAITRLHKN